MLAASREGATVHHEGAFMKKRSIVSRLSVLLVLGALCGLVAIAPPAGAEGDDREALAVARRLPVGRDAVDVVVNSQLRRVYVLNQETYESPGTLSVFDAATNSLLATPTVGYLPTSVTVNSRTNRIYVAGHDETFLGIVTVLDGVSNQTVKTIRFPGHAFASELVVDETTGNVYALAVDFWECFPPEEAEKYEEDIKTKKKGAKPPKCDGYVISVIDGTTDELQKDAVVQLPGNGVSRIALNATTQRLYVLNSFSEDMTVVELKKGKGKIIAPSVSVAYGPTTEWGRQPSALVVDPITNRIYTANRLNSTIVAIDGNTNSLFSTIDHGGGTSTDIAVNPVLRRAYATDYNSLVVIDLDTNQPVGWAPSDEAFAVTVDLHTARVYSPFKSDISCEYFGCHYTLGVFMPVNYIHFPGVSPGSERVAINPHTDRMYIVNSNTSDVTVLDTRTGAMIARIPVGYGPREAAINLITNRIYVTMREDAKVTVIDGNTNTVVGSVPVGQDGTQWIIPFGVTVNPQTNLVYTANKAEDSVSIISGETNTLIGTVAVGDEPWDVVYDSLTNQLYVPNRLSNNVSVIDAASHEVVMTVPLPPDSSPTVTDVSAASGEVLVAGKALYVIDVRSNMLTGVVPFGGTPTDIVVDDATNTAYIGLGSAGVAVVDTVNDKLVAHVELLGAARGVTVDPDTGTTWVVGGGGNWDVSSFTAF